MSTKGTFVMSASHTPLSADEFVADAPVARELRPRHWMSRLRSWQGRTSLSEAEEGKLRQRAHRQALALMAASSVVSGAALYGVWTLLRAVI
jgi:hypothetical protein